MPKGVKRPKSERLQKELNEVIENLQKAEIARTELKVKKESLEKEIRAYENESILNLVEESGLSPDELRAVLASYNNASAVPEEAAATINV